MSRTIPEGCAKVREITHPTRHGPGTEAGQDGPAVSIQPRTMPTIS